MSNKMYIGVDVGSKGVITTQINGEFSYYFISDNDLYQLSDIFSKIRTNNENIACVIEDVHAVFGSAASATFSFGENKGMLLGLLCANKIPFTLVQPKEWQKCMWTNSDMVVEYKTSVDKKGNTISRKKVNTKQTSYNCAKRLFPNIDFRKSERCKNFDDNKVDSILMSEYARRKNL